jgi:O-antigen ligase
MKSIPIEYLHLQTGVIFLFLAMVIRTEFGRATDPEYDVQGGFAQLRWLPFAFLLMAVAFTGLLHDVSPLLGVELAAGVTLSLLHPVNALCFMIHFSILRPWEIVPDNPVLTPMPRLLVLLCMISWLIHPDRHADLSLRKHRGVLFLLAFSGWLLLTALKTPSITATVQDWYSIYFTSLTVFGIALFLIESERSVREVQLTLVISSMALMATALYRYFSVGLTMGRLISVGTLGEPNDMGTIIVMALPFALVPMFEKTTGLMAKATGLLYTGMAAGVIWLTRSRGTMLAVVAEFFVMRIVRSKKKRLGLLLTAGLLGAGYAGLMSIVPRDTSEMEASSGSRITFWKAAVNMAVHDPFLGVGFNQFPENYMSYAVGTIYERGKRTAHSSWFLALGESGFIGFFFFCAFFISVARIAWHNRGKRPAQLYAVAGYGVAMSFLSNTYTQYFYLLMALVLASASVKPRINAAV